MPSLSELLSDVTVGWPVYREAGRVDKNHPAYTLIVETIPTTLRKLLEQRSYLTVKGSTGEGLVTAAPWVLIRDNRVSHSAGHGYYVVYLYSVELRHLYLCIGFGTKQFSDLKTSTRGDLPKIKSARALVQPILKERIWPEIPEPLQQRIKDDPIQLEATQREKLHRTYEQGTIWAIQYNLSDLPSDSELINDLENIVGIYQSIAENSLIPSIEDLLDASIEKSLVDDQIQIEIHEFFPRPTPKRSGSRAGRGGKRHSKRSTKIGRAGEDHVMRAERESLIEEGRPDLAELIVHNAERNEFPGWDITSCDADDQKRFIEVKSSAYKLTTSIDLTENEWAAAKNPEYRQRYHLYLVTEALSKASRIHFDGWKKVGLASAHLSIAFL